MGGANDLGRLCHTLKGPQHLALPARVRPQQAPRPPGAVPIEREELVAFQRSLRPGPWRCLVLRDGDRTSWYSPDFGLVLHEEAGRVRTDLAFAQVVR